MIVFLSRTMDSLGCNTASENVSLVLDIAEELRTAVEKEGKCGESSTAVVQIALKKSESLQNMHQLISFTLSCCIYNQCTPLLSPTQFSFLLPVSVAYENLIFQIDSCLLHVSFYLLMS